MKNNMLDPAERENEGIKKLQEATILILVNLLDPEILKHYKQVFKQLDVDGNGTISRDELLEGFSLTQMAIEENYMEAEIDKIWEKLNLKEG